MQHSLKKQLVNQATQPYRETGQFNYRWARGKLGGDPIFAGLIEHGVFQDGMRIMDLGCGRGLLAAWFLAAEKMLEKGQWQAPVKPPKQLHFRGVELMGREAECGNRALQPHYPQRVQLSGGDMREADLSNLDAVAILDVLHYIPYAEQNVMLDKIRAALGDKGIFITRVGNAGSGLRFKISQFVDRSISFVQGHRLPRMWCRPVTEWEKILIERGFSVQAIPMSAGTPFANVMLVARVKLRSTA